MDPQPPAHPTEQPPAWTQYDIEHKYAPPHIPTSWMERQKAAYQHDLATWAGRLNMPVPWLIGILIALVAVCGSCGLGSLALAGNPQQQAVSASATATTQAAIDSAVATATAYAAPTTTPYPTATVGPSPTPLPTATPFPTATPSTMVLQVDGNGSKTTATFTVHGTWEVAWTCAAGPFLIQFYDAHTNDYALNLQDIQYDCSNGSGSDTSTMHGSGDYFMTIDGTSSWIVTVTDLPN